FNSLTLSPALSALLLRPREKGGFVRLPGLAFALAGLMVGARLGWEAPWAAGLEERALDFLSGAAPGGFVGGLKPVWSTAPSFHGLVAGGTVGLMIGAAIGWPLAWPSNRLLGAFFRLFNGSFDLSTNVYTRSVGVMLRGSVIVLLLYCGLLALTYFGFTR